jgi:hypothetical protein
MRSFLFAAALAATGLISAGAFAAPPAGTPAEQIAVVSIEASGSSARCAALAEAYDISTPSPASADTLVQAQALRREGGMLCSRDMERAGSRYLSSAIDIRVGKPGASASY